MMTPPAWSLSSVISSAEFERVTTGKPGKESREADIENTPDCEERWAQADRCSTNGHQKQTRVPLR